MMAFPASANVQKISLAVLPGIEEDAEANEGLAGVYTLDQRRIECGGR
jgi:hypothetical protein